MLHKKINQDIPRTRKSPPDYMPTVTGRNRNIIGSLKNGKSSGPYSIPTNLFKILSYHIAIPLSAIVNESFAKGVFPDKLKVCFQIK